MHLVHQVKDKDGNLTQTWEVAWTWLPHFIATNPDIVKHVVKGLGEKFVGAPVRTDGLMQAMDMEVIQLVVQKLPMPGLQDYLLRILDVRPEEELT